MPDVEKTDAQWRRQLTPDEYRICRQRGTERAFSGEYYDTKAPGRYHCTCCDGALFDSEAKYDSGSGWPSFYQPLTPAVIDTTMDVSHAMERNEVHCGRCGSHLGHVFDDGPPPTGQRYCINSVSLKLEKRDV